MLVGVIQKPTLAEMAALIRRMDTSLYDILELRLDACADISVAALRSFSLPLPAIFTLRCKEQGGFYAQGEEEREDLLEKLMQLGPAYVDLEYSIPPERIRAIRAISPNTKVILSRHDFAATPASLEDMLAPMRKAARESSPDGVIYKLATLARGTLDTLRMLVFCKERKESVIGICMGEDGMTSRILAPVINAGFCYCPVEESSAPGQIDARVLRRDYNFYRLNKETAIYGLVGDPIDRSVGHLYHNRQNAEANCNAVYVKWRLTRGDIPDAMPFFGRLGVAGLSVTMPLKEMVMPFLADRDEAVSAIGAVNTLKREKGAWVGVNTDGPGSLALLPTDPTGRKIVFLGAGGAARAVMHEVGKYTGDIVVFNRSRDKKLPADVPLLPFSRLRELSAYDVVINALPSDASFPFGEVPFIAGALAVDLSYGKKSLFLEKAEEAGCLCRDGSGMFTRQAELQRVFWGLPVV
ncbi:shikimate dehydrogenase (NADP(+)) [Deltaproteobacteria bacterium]|nr:shikimate dehydrogenase (NADP(+)) [Deltaproteobacteria bacterium]